MPDRYNTPSQGTSDWHLPLNENFSNIDIDAEHRGSGDPDTNGISPENGAKYLDVDTGDIYLADGSAWSLEWNLEDVEWRDNGTVVTTDSTVNLRDNLTVTQGGSGEAIIDASGGGTAGDHIGSASDPVLSITNTHYREVVKEAAVTGDHTVDLTEANVHVLTLTGDTTLSFTGSHSDLTTGATLIIKQDETGDHALTWDEDMYWPGGTEPSPSTNAGDRHKFVIENVAGDWEGATVGEDFGLVAAPVVIDDYEWGETNTVSDFYSGNTAQFDATTATPVQEGSYSLKGSPESAATPYEIHSQEGDGLDEYPQQGDTFSAWIHSDSANDVRTGLIFGVQDLFNYYVARMEIDSTDGRRLQIATRIDDSYTARANRSVTLSENTWYENEIEWQTDDTIIYTVYDESGSEVASASWTDTDSTFADQTGFGYYLYEGTDGTATVAYDNVRRL